MKSYLVLLCYFCSTALNAQALRENAPKIFVDCQWWCDEDYLKTELAYLNFVRDRAVADVFIQQTALSTGSGGLQFTLMFLGQKQWSGQNDTLSFALPPAASDEQQRQGMKKNLERGLLPYLLKTSLADQISFQITAPANPDQKPAEDPWNFWTFSVRANLEAQGQEAARSFWFNGSLVAQRVTERQKTQVYGQFELNRDRFQLEDGKTEVYGQGGWRVGASQVMAINDHWSYGLAANLGQSQYRNQKRTAVFEPGLEYNVFPFREAATRQLSFRYGAGFQHNNYFQETIFFKTKELLWRQSLSATYRQVMNWGAFNLGFRAGNYLHDWSLHAVNLSGGFELNVFKGFRFHFYGDFSLLHNQVELPNGGATPQEVYLRVRQLKTNYNYYAWCGVSYTFGSIYSNVVNQRFAGVEGY